MLNENSAPTACEEYARIARALENQLKKLDRAGAFKAAAHLDAAIQQLRRDRLALEIAAAAHEAPEDGARHRNAAAPPPASPSETTVSEALAPPHVFPRKAKPATAR